MKKTYIMGVLNVTPDSFYDGGEYFGNVNKAVIHAKKMIEEGADIIDIGGESSRPGAEKIPVEEEIQRVIPIIQKIREKLGKEIILSIDTYKSIVAKKAVQAGANIINDISGLQLDPEMSDVVAETGAKIIINHLRGDPETMQKGKIQYTDVIRDISYFFSKQIAIVEKKRVSKERIILDPGFGFGKTVEHNLEILKRLEEFGKLGFPIMIGVSRKSTIGKVLGQAFGKEFPPSERLEGSLAATAVAVLNGATIVRTHDVGETKRFVTVLDAIKLES